MTLDIDFITVLYIIVGISFILLFFVLPRWGPHYTSRLTCPSCKRIFNFHWIPGATISSIIQRGNRTLRCPYCHTKATYDVINTRIAKPKIVKKQKAHA